MRAQNRTKLMAAIVLLVIAGFLLLRMSRQQRSMPAAVAEQLTEVPSVGGPLSKGEPGGTQQRPCSFFVSAGARPDPAARAPNDK